jgi:hypothetical protein
VFLSEFGKRGYFSLCRSEDAVLPKISATDWLLPGVALTVGVLGMSAVWVAVAVLSERPCSWLALFAALDMAMLLRLTNAPPGLLRMLLAVAATAAAAALSHWMIAASQMGFVLGLEPMASALRLGPVLAWEMSKLSLNRVDWILLLSSLPLAAILADGRKPSR